MDGTVSLKMRDTIEYREYIRIIHMLKPQPQSVAVFGDGALKRYLN